MKFKKKDLSEAIVTLTDHTGKIEPQDFAKMGEFAIYTALGVAIALLKKEPDENTEVSKMDVSINFVFQKEAGKLSASGGPAVPCSTGCLNGGGAKFAPVDGDDCLCI